MAEESAFDRIGKRLTPERREEMRQERLKRKASLTLAFQLGIYVGEYIIHRFLPTLSVDLLHTNKNISVTAAEADECKRLTDDWLGKCWAFKGTEEEKHKATEKEWKALRAYHEMLEEKYLPKTVECHMHTLNITEEHMDDFKSGIGIALWDCDCSHYLTEPENIDVKDEEDGYFTVITLKKG